MTPPAAAPPPARSRLFNQPWTWWFTLIVLVLVAAIRLRLLNYPLERDEGEYAYAGQLMLQGIPPYELAYNMKFPGTYAMYALIMALFGENPAGTHFGLLLVTTASAMMLYWLGKRLLDVTAGMVAATSFALLSATPTIFGLSGHATHFVVLFAIAGLCFMWRARQETCWQMPLLAGIMFGLAVLMKQHAVLMGVWAGAVFAVECLRKSEIPIGQRLARLAAFCGGAILPFAMCCLLLWHAGVFGKFWFWTVDYARHYASMIPADFIWYRLKYNFGWVVKRGLWLWLLGGAGLFTIWFDPRWRGIRWWLLGFSLTAVLATFPGFYFREHYFILALPAVALLAGVVVSSACQWWRQRAGGSKFSQWPVGGYALVVLLTFYRNYDVWFQMNPTQAARAIYVNSPFPEAEVVSAFIRANSKPDERIAVLGSEPEIYFLSRRHSVTGYIYTYALMEPQPFALQMQNEMIHDIETAKPRFVIFASIASSWTRVIGSDTKILDWWDSYKTNYVIVGLADVISPTETRYLWNEDAVRYGKPQATGLEVYQRKPVTFSSPTNAAPNP